jgi:hypothetical protein
MKGASWACLIFAALLLLGCSNGQTRPDISGYLDAKWGMSRSEIKGIVKLPLDSETDNIVIYNDKIGADNVGRMYMFDNKDRLLGVMMVFEVVPEDERTFRNKFLTVYNNLALKYGDADSYVDEDLTKKGLSAQWTFKSSVILFQFQLKRPFNRLALGLLYLNKAFAKEYLGSKPLDKF